VETLDERNLTEFVNELRQEWRTMWRSRINDKIQAEDIADKDYERLFVNRGLILFATRNFEPPSFQEILERHLTRLEAERVNPNPIRGGIRKFIREYITSQSKIYCKKMLTELEKASSNQQHKHGGRGWLHFSMPKKQ